MPQPTIFISYSHKDEKEKDLLLSHLSVLQNAGLVDPWVDDRIGAGANWEEEIREAMARAKVAILLITANFLTSEFILGQEVPALLQRREREGLTVFPVIAKACAWKQTDWLTRMNVRPRNARPIFRTGGNATTELAAIAEEVAAIIKRGDASTGSKGTEKITKPAPRKTPSSPQISQHVPFTNREDEMQGITSSFAPPYHLLDAPAGYGKTELLKQLEKRFTERKWRCVYVAVSEKNSSNDLINALARQLGIELDSADGAIPLITQLGGGLRHQWANIPDKEGNEGVVLLIDLEKKPSLTVLQELVQLNIPKLEENLRVLATFTAKPNRFRIILAGRYLASHLKTKGGGLPLRILHLSPFSNEIIRTSVREYLPDHDEASIDQLSAHLFFLTGGHPGCMARILEMYKEMAIAPDDLLVEPFASSIWKNVMSKFIDDIHDGIPQSPRDLRKVLDRMSVFRFMDYDILKSSNGEPLSKDFSEYELADELTGTYLLSWRGRFFRDDITRRLLAVHLRHEKPDEFRDRSVQARRICASRLQQPNVQSPESWTIEYLFQSLQRHSNDIQDPSQRSQIRSRFMQRDVGDALKFFMQERSIAAKMWRQELEALIQGIDEDWEFRFTVNYYLRGNKYTDEPYNQLRQQIEQFFAHQSGGNNA